MIRGKSISLKVISDKLIQLVPELLLLQVFYSIFKFYVQYFTYLYIKLNNFLVTITNRFINKSISIKSNLIPSLTSIYKREGTLSDVWFACNLITIVCGSIWFYLQWQNNYKRFYAYDITTWTALIGYFTTSISQLNSIFKKSQPKMAWSKPSNSVVAFLKSETTFMLIITELILESTTNSYKIAFLVFHSVLMLLGLIECSHNKAPVSFIAPLKGLLLFSFCMVEILVMGVFWLETLKHGFDKALLFTVCYSLRWEDSRTNQIAKNIKSYIRQLRQNKLNESQPLQAPVPIEKSAIQEFKRLTSFGFDTFSIISDIH
ncbi:uncharacterized protein SPAPADRAFT_149801 [Spathaspora passalidarum NRRL Y-27907]|uniref:Uncharacterized protein n=1 Tax=Spathaspora passalidarum (strain NRRL Y-27907 / 11-Y1) TaxID=619300 RepID=G3ALV1_SPAPN|nr:uncharacterized protein SPAPADRAFT_149801 [Spathaspora passalidarum NRRL Y-27907]EGW32710.1 hypothetical protein SPAPADRAFT_149801 [Spathaspora passalidarum NRRL Y-27907]